MVDPVAEYNEIVKWTYNLIGSKITPGQLVQRLGIFLNRRHSVSVHLQISESISLEDFSIGAMYDPSCDELGHKPLKLFFIINYPKSEPWDITYDRMSSLSMDLIEALVHEYQHLYQYRVRDFVLNRRYNSYLDNRETKADQEYLGNTDEIDAYAMNIAVRFFLSGFDLTSGKLYGSPDIDIYRRAFGDNHPVVKRLIKKICMNFTHLKKYYTSTKT